MTLSEARLEAIARRLVSWVEVGDPPPDPDDVGDLLAEVRLMRRVHASDVALLNTTRDQLSAILVGYQEIADQLTAVNAQDAAEVADSPAPPDRFPGDAWDPEEVAP